MNKNLDRISVHLIIDDYLEKCKANAESKDDIKVLDMCCGKGGDLLKWRNANIKHLICVDLAEVSIKQCKDRYQEMLERNRNPRYPPIFSAEFYDADCTKVGHHFIVLSDVVLCRVILMPSAGPHKRSI